LPAPAQPSVPGSITVPFRHACASFSGRHGQTSAEFNIPTSPSPAWAGHAISGAIYDRTRPVSPSWGTGHDLATSSRWRIVGTINQVSIDACRPTQMNRNTEELLPHNGKPWSSAQQRALRSGWPTSRSTGKASDPAIGTCWPPTEPIWPGLQVLLLDSLSRWACGWPGAAVRPRHATSVPLPSTAGHRVRRSLPAAAVVPHKPLRRLADILHHVYHSRRLHGQLKGTVENGFWRQW